MASFESFSGVKAAQIAEYVVLNIWHHTMTYLRKSYDTKFNKGGNLAFIFLLVIDLVSPYEWKWSVKSMGKEISIFHGWNNALLII